MRSKRIPAEEQYRLIMECRQSGLTDHQWCVEHDIKRENLTFDTDVCLATLYNYVRSGMFYNITMDDMPMPSIIHFK